MGRMVRKQVYIEPRQEQALKRLAEGLGASEAKLIREGIERVICQGEAGGPASEGLPWLRPDPGLEFMMEAMERLSAAHGISLARAVRDALEAWIARNQPLPRSLGMGDSGRTDVSRRIGEEGFVPRPWR